MANLESDDNTSEEDELAHLESDDNTGEED